MIASLVKIVKVTRSSWGKIAAFMRRCKYNYYIIYLSFACLMKDYKLYTDLELFALLAQDDHLAFEAVYDRYKGVLFMHAYRILGDQEEAKDVLQELFAGLWHKRTSIHVTSSVSSYLYGAVRNRIFDMLAHKKVEQNYLISLAEFIDAGECQTDHGIREIELAEIIEREVGLLPQKMRQIFEMSRQQNLSHKQIADQLGISDKTVKKQVSNALIILREKIDIAYVLTLILAFL